MTVIGDSNKAFYQHLASFAPGIAPGTVVHAGQLLGYSGIGGGIAHLHFALEHGDTDQILHEAVIASPSDHATNQNPGSAVPHIAEPSTLQCVEPGHTQSSHPPDAAAASDPGALQSIPPSDAQSPHPPGATAPTDQSTFHNVSTAQSSQTQDPAAVSDKATFMSAGRDIHAANGRFFTADEYRHIVEHDGSHIASGHLVDGSPHAANVNGASSNDDSQVIASVGGDHGLHPGTIDPSTLDPGATHSAPALHAGDHGLHPATIDPSTLDPGATHSAATLHAGDHGLHPATIDPSTLDPGATHHSVTSSHGSDHSASVVDHHAAPTHNSQLDPSHSAAHTAAAHTAGSDHHDAAIVG
jgi:hypothetical protein